MRKIAITFLTIVFFLGVSQTQANIVWNDGGTHDIDYTIDESISVYGGPDSTTTTVNMVFMHSITLLST